ncbi:MAG: metal-dependent hydrolase [Gammaproteobacteria bacterium]|nr:metal-dependent hydrolase [Gammaproteobacteria bacterium]
MDSITQIALGAAVAEATIGRKVGRKALLWGAIAGTLPDLDVFVPLGDAVKNFTYHRSASHSIFILALITPLIVWLINKTHPQYREHSTRWAITIYLVFFTHVMLDSFTTFGTQIFWPIDNTPVAFSSIFIIDPLYTLPLLIGIIAALVLSREANRGHLINRYGLIISTLYLGWGLMAKNIASVQIKDALQQQKIAHHQVFITAAPLNTLLWRTIVMSDDGYYQGFYSLLDEDNKIDFQFYPSDESLLNGIEDTWTVQRLKWFSRGIYSINVNNHDVMFTDLRMGMEPSYTFRFKVAELGNPHIQSVIPEHKPSQRSGDIIIRTWERIWDKTINP